MKEISKKKLKLILKFLGIILILAGITMLVVGLTDFITSLTRSEEPSLFICSFLSIPTFFIGISLTIYGFMRKVNLTITKEVMNTDDNLHKVTVTQTLGRDTELFLKKICSSCKTANDSDNLFCKHCGNRL